MSLARAFAHTLRLVALSVAILSSSAALAQPSDLPIKPATTDQYPPGVKVAQVHGGAVYANKSGRTLYGMDMRTLLRLGPDPSQHCTGTCAAEWQPLLAPEGSVPNIRFPGAPGQSEAPAAKFIENREAPDWTVIQGTTGPQWVYKGWHMVFVRKGDKRGSTAFDGAGGKTWNTLKYVPPVPAIVAPGNVQPVFVDGAYALADAKGRLLFTGKCAVECNRWEPFAGGMASAGIGNWRVGTAGDVPQWQYGKAPVFVSADPKTVPEGGKVLRP